MELIIKNKTNFLIVVLTLSLNGFIFQSSNIFINAQSDIFLTSHWYFEEGEVNGDPFPGVGMTFTRIDFSDYFQINYYLNSCEETILVPFNDLTNDSFILEAIEEYDLCNFTDPGDISAIEISRSLFFEIPIDENGTPKNPFSYSISETLNDDYELLITNANGDWALFLRDQLANTDDFSLNNFVIYPSPVIESLNIKNNSNQQFTASIYNINGKLLLSHFLKDSIATIDVRALKQGLYFMKFENENGEKGSKKFVKL